MRKDRFKNSPKYSVGEIAGYITARCTNAEMLAIAFEVNHRMQKRVESISEQCYYTTNEGTPDEDYELDEEKYNSLNYNWKPKRFWLMNWNGELVKTVGIQIYLKN